MSLSDGPWSRSFLSLSPVQPLVPDSALQRTIRRCTAVLAILLSIHLLQFHHFSGSNGGSLPGWFSFLVPALAILYAVTYLLASLVAFVLATPWEDERSTQG